MSDLPGSWAEEPYRGPEPEVWGDGCECWVTPEKDWFRYGSAVEPASQIEWNPECPMHPPVPIEALGGDQL